MKIGSSPVPEPKKKKKTLSGRKFGGQGVVYIISSVLHEFLNQRAAKRPSAGSPKKKQEMRKRIQEAKSKTEMATLINV